MPMSPGARFKSALVALLLELVLHELCAGTCHDENKNVNVRKCLGTRPSKVHTTRNIVPLIFKTHFRTSFFTQQISSHVFHNIFSSSYVAGGAPRQA